MQLKYCIAKMVGTEPVYRTDTVNTWVSDIADSTVEWYASEGAARNALQGPETFVVPYEDITMTMRCDALTRACEALAEAIRIGAVEGNNAFPLFTTYEVFSNTLIDVVESNVREGFIIMNGMLHGVKISCARKAEVEE